MRNNFKIKKILLFGFSLVFIFSILFLGFFNSKMTTINELNQYNNLVQENKNKDIVDLDYESIDFDNLNILVKNEDITIFQYINNDHFDYYVLNNQIGTYFKQEEMSQYNINYKMVGYDEFEKVFHFRNADDSHDYSENYYYKIKTNEFIQSSNNYQYDDNVDFVISKDSGWNVKYYLAIEHSKDSFSDWEIYLEQQTWNYGSDPYINSIHNYNNGIWYLEILTNPHSTSWHFLIDLESQRYIRTGIIDAATDLVAIKGNYALYSDNSIVYFEYNENNHSVSEIEEYKFSESNLISKNNGLNYLINDSGIFKVGNQNYLVNFNNYIELPTIIKLNLNTNLEYEFKQSDNGFYYYLDDEGNFGWVDEFGNINEIYINSDLDSIISANQESIVILNDEGKIESGNIYHHFGISFDKNVNYFYDEKIQNKIYLDGTTTIHIDNDLIKYVWVDNSGNLIEPIDPNKGIWEIDLRTFDENNIKLGWELYSGEKYYYEIEIKENYMPVIEISTGYEGNLDKNVYYEEGYEKNAGLVDGYYSKYQKSLKTSDFYIDKIKIDDKEINNMDGDLDEIENGSYELDNSIRFNEIEILDKFGKDWTYHIYNYDNGLIKYWYETKIGIENIYKANELGYNANQLVKSANAVESYNYSIALDETFDLIRVDDDEFIRNHNSQTDFIDESGYNARIPINQYYADSSIIGVSDYNGNTNLSLRMWYEHWIIDNINDFYGLNLVYGDVKFVFDENLVNENEEKMNLENQMGHFEATSQGIESGRVIGQSGSWTDTGKFFQYIPLSDVNSEQYQKELDINLEIAFGGFSNDNFNYYDTFGLINDEFNQIIYDTLIEFENQMGSSGSYYGFNLDKVDEEIMSINNLEFKYYDQNGMRIDSETYLRDISSVSINIVFEENSIFINNNQTIENVNLEYFEFNNPIIGEINSPNWMAFGISIGIIIFLILFAFMIWFLENKRKEKVLMNQNTDLNLDEELLKAFNQGSNNIFDEDDIIEDKNKDK